MGFISELILGLRATRLTLNSNAINPETLQQLVEEWLCGSRDIEMMKFDCSFWLEEIPVLYDNLRKCLIPPMVLQETDESDPTRPTFWATASRADGKNIRLLTGFTFADTMIIVIRSFSRE